MKGSLRNILKFYRDLPIRGKLVFILYIQILIPLIFIGYLSYRNSEEIIKKKSSDYSLDILKMIELRLNDYVNNLTVISQDLLYDNRIYAVLNNDDLKKDPLLSYEYENEITNTMKKITFSRTEIQSICLISNNGKYYAADNNSVNVSIKDLLPYEKGRLVLEKARESGNKPVWYLDSEDGRVKNIFLARTVNNLDDFREIGLLVILVKKEFLDTVYQGLTRSMKNIAILSSKNELIAVRDPENIHIFSSDFFMKMKEERGSYTDKAAGALISYVSLGEPDWRVIAYAPLKDLYKDADALRQNIIILCILSVLIVSVLSTYIAIDFINPINRLVRGMKKVQKGEGAVYIEEDRADELGFLNKTFNEMSREIHHLVNWVYREQITRKEAELKALQSQINPHFLFNTLESINWMAQLNNVPEISETVSDLSALMEASIGRDDRLITLEEEFTYADKYISLLKRRFEDKIELHKQVAAEVLDIKIPRLLIQPLIENAVHHGIEKSRGKGIIRLNAHMDGDRLFIEVVDNGTGIDREELLMLNERLSMDNDTYFKNLGKKKSRSIGIENVNRRIKLFYGENYGLKIESEEGSFTKVIVTIPLKPEDTREGYYVQGIDHR